MAGRIRPTGRRRAVKALAAVALVFSGAVAAAVVPSAATASTASAAGPIGHTVFGTSWPVYHHDGLGSGADPTSTNLSPAVAAWTSAGLDGQIFGEPLVAAGRVIVATENDTIDELAANTGAVLWSTHVGTAVPSGNLPCGNIAPLVGITGTPVIDQARGEVFAVTDESAGGSGAQHFMVGLDLYTGAVLLHQPIVLSGSDQLAQLQRTGLALDNGNVVAGFGGNAGDCGNYHGWVVSIPEGGGAQQSFEVASTPGDSQGAVWMGGAAPEVDGQGNVWLTTGNSAFTSSSDAYDNSDGVVELSPSMGVRPVLRSLHLVQRQRERRRPRIQRAGTGVGQRARLPGREVPTGLPALAVAPGWRRRTAPDRLVVLRRRTSTGGGGVGGTRLRALSVRGRGRGDRRAQQRERLVADQHRRRADPPSRPGGSSGSSGGRRSTGSIPPRATRSRASPSGRWPTTSPHRRSPTGCCSPPRRTRSTPSSARPVFPPRRHPHRLGPGYWTTASDGGVFSFGGAGFARVDGWQASRRAGGGDHRHRGRRGVLAGGLRRRGLRIRRRRLLRLHGRPAPGQAHGGVGRRAQRRRLLDRGLRRRGLRLRGCGVLRFHGRTAAGPPRGGDGRHLRRRRVLARRPRTGESSRSATPGSSARWGEGSSPDLWWRWQAAVGGGYWMVGSDGGIFSFGGAGFFGSMGGRPLSRPVVGMTPTSSGQGYWEVASDGGIFTFGDAPFEGSEGGARSGRAHGGHRRAATALTAASGRVLSRRSLAVGRVSRQCPSQCQRQRQRQFQRRRRESGVGASSVRPPDGSAWGRGRRTHPRLPRRRHRLGRDDPWT